MAARTTLYPEVTPSPIGVDVDLPAALSLHDLCSEIGALVAKVRDDSQRSGESDIDLLAQASLLQEFAERYGWGRTERFPQPAVDELRAAVESLDKARAFLRTGAASVQRTLKTPRGEDMSFIVARSQVRRRQNAPYCYLPAADRDGASVLAHLTVPGVDLSLSVLLFKCATLKHAARVLRSIGLEAIADSENPAALRCRDELILCHHPS